MLQPELDGFSYSFAESAFLSTVSVNNRAAQLFKQIRKDRYMEESGMKAAANTPLIIKPKQLSAKDLEGS